MQHVTIKTLADLLQLSTATVSKALGDSYEISIETKERVKRLASELNYVPDLYASSLRKRKSKTIAVVIPEVTDSFFAQAISGIEAVAQDKGYHVLVYLTHEKFSKEQAILRDFQSGRVDGVLISVTSETTDAKHIKELEAIKIPIVFFDRVCEEMETAKITTNDYESGYKATAHLIECGCKKIVLLSISKILSISRQRIQGYKQALQDHSIAFNKSNIIYCTHSEAHNYPVIKRLMAGKHRPDGAIASVEKLVSNVYLACKELELNIPNDVKVISFSNLQTASLLNPSLSTITQPAFNMGKTAATLLFKALCKENFNLKKESIVIPSILDIRDSTVKSGKSCMGMIDEDK